MKKIELPHSMLEISCIGFGGWPVAGGFNWGWQDTKESVKAIHKAFENGINFFDTAPGYGSGDSEKIIGKELKKYRNQVIFATKVSPNDFNYQALKNACEQRLSAMNTDYIDLLQLHWPNNEIPIGETLSALEDLKMEGKIRAYGFSNYGVKGLNEALAQGAKISCIQLPYNLLWRAIEFEILPFCITYNIPVIGYMPIMQGLLTGKFNTPDEVPDERARTRHFSKNRQMTRHSEDGCEKETFETIKKLLEISKDIDVPLGQVSIAWLLKQKGIGAVLVGVRNSFQVMEAINAEKLNLIEKTNSMLIQASEQLKQILGKNPDLWMDKSRFY
jgi:myo-inositol catabolism protein IolS